MMVVGILTTINHPGERKDEHPQAPKVNASKKTLTIKKLLGKQHPCNPPNMS